MDNGVTPLQLARFRGNTRVAALIEGHLRPRGSSSRTGGVAPCSILNLIFPLDASPSTSHRPTCPRKAAALIWPSPSAFWPLHNKSPPTSWNNTNFYIFVTKWLSGAQPDTAPAVSGRSVAFDAIFRFIRRDKARESARDDHLDHDLRHL